MRLIKGVQILHFEESHTQIQIWKWTARLQYYRKGLGGGGVVDCKVHMNDQCALVAKKCQEHNGLYQQECALQARGSDFSALFRSSKITIQFGHHALGKT